LTLFESAAAAGPGPEPIVAFVGTFDNRKGGHDLPGIFREVSRQVPDVRFRLLGTAGLYQSAEQVSAFFPKALRSRLEVTPKFQADELPSLLAGASVGVFPSYIEGFGLGVLEMLAASVPVVAYRTPGPPEMLKEEFLVDRGDVPAMAARVVSLLRNREELSRARQWAGVRSRDFAWSRVATETDAVYRAHAALLRGGKALSCPNG
jgi:glycosyltransferase involved in cell wall biosynthesis